MKKINYLVLMVAMMMLGTNALATTHEVASDAQFETAWTNASSGDVIKLTDAITLTKTMWLGTENMNDASRKIEIDLNGYNLLTSAQYAFLLTHGTLKISNSRPASGQVQGTYTKYTNAGVFSGSANLFYVTGSTNKDIDPSVDGANYFTHLEIGEGVIVRQVHYDALITISEENKDGVAQKAYTAANCVPEKPALTYITNVYGTSETNGKAVAHGVRVDLKGTINGTKYGIKANGNLGSPFERVAAGETSVSYAETSSFANVKTYTIANSDADLCPFVYIYPTGRITVLDAAPAGITDKNPVGIYASGYARWKVEGYAEGCNGAVIKSGQMDFTDATVIGTGPVYHPAYDLNSGTETSGNGIVIESSTAYSGDIEVAIGGNSEISSQNGYALEEVITSSDNKTDVETLFISGGSFEGSPDQGTIKITEETTNNETTIIEVSGGQLVGTNPENLNAVSIGGLRLIEFSGTAGEGAQEQSHITVTTDEYGDKVMVIVSGETPNGDEDIFQEGEAVNWKHSSSLDKTAMTVAVDENLRLDQLQINQDYSQTVTVKDGKTLEVGSVILGEKAQIIVEPGATFKVTKKDGIYSPKVSNLVLQTQAEKPSIFLFNPAVTTNAHPGAKVEFKSTKSFRENGTNKRWERFGLPTWNGITSISCDQPSLQTAIAIFGAEGWDACGILIGNELEGIAKLNKPFISCELLANTLSATPANATYTFTGRLVGNSNAKLNVDHEWTPYANSYSANIDVATLLARLASAVNVDQVIYLANYAGNSKLIWDAYDMEWDDGKQLSPMEAFILHNHGNAPEEISINYGDAVWTPATAASPAPRRAVANDITAKLRIIVESTQGEWDNVKLSESTTNLRNAVKYMNDNMNLYAHGNDDKLAIVASENLEGTYFGFSTVEGGVFTISFANVEGREFELVDLQTGAMITVKEGSTYMFTASDNTTNDYRFKLVVDHKVPTAVDAISGEKNQSGVYTMLGQYVGEMNQWNILPAGVYVVNGKKIVK